MPKNEAKKFAGIVKDNKLYFTDQNYFNERIKEFEGQTVLVTIVSRKDLRTLRQNALYWSWLTILSNHIGYDKDELHEILKKEYFGAESFTIPIFGQEVSMERVTTTTKTTKQMSEYMNWIHNKAQEFYQITLPTVMDGFEYKGVV
jgi:hypothetical protein